MGLSRPINGCNANGSECHGLLRTIPGPMIYTKELWNSEMNATDNISVFNKFSCPTIALGKVLPGSQPEPALCIRTENKYHLPHERGTE